MKLITRAITLWCQYFYYALNKIGIYIAGSSNKFLVDCTTMIIAITECLILLTIQMTVIHLLAHIPLHNINYTVVLTIFFFLYFVLDSVNRKLLGTPERIDEYTRRFDSWSKGSRLLLAICVFSAPICSMELLMDACEAIKIIQP